jgi:hypothetical protein
VAVGVLGFVLAAPALAAAEEDRLPLLFEDAYLSPLEATETPAFPTLEGEFNPALPTAYNPVISIRPYLGLQALPIEFAILHYDGNWRTVDGLSRMLLGTQIMYQIGEDLHFGVDLEFTKGGHIEMFGVGACASYCFWETRKETWRRTLAKRTEHHLTASLLWQRLNIVRAHFGEFDETFGGKVGYAIRMTFSGRASFDLAIGVRAAYFEYSDDLQIDGDEDIMLFGAYGTFGFSFFW